jgi:hypothetical protein
MFRQYKLCRGKVTTLFCLFFLIVISFVLLGGCTSPVDVPVNQSTGQAVHAEVTTVSNITVSPSGPVRSVSLYDYQAGLAELPEIKNGDMDLAMTARYKKLIDTLSAKDPGAAQWVVSTGLFAEDRKITDAEARFVDAVVKKDDPLRILVTRWVLDGIGDSEAGWAVNASYPGGEYGYLTDDVRQIELVKGPVDPKAKEALKAIIRASESDDELRKGISLIDEYGIPDKTRFKYPVPAYNTQLSVLLDLLRDSDIPLDTTGFPWQPASITGLWRQLATRTFRHTFRAM